MGNVGGDANQGEHAHGVRLRIGRHQEPGFMPGAQDFSERTRERPVGVDHPIGHRIGGSHRRSHEQCGPGRSPRFEDCIEEPVEPRVDRGGRPGGTINRSLQRLSHGLGLTEYEGSQQVVLRLEVPVEAPRRKSGLGQDIDHEHFVEAVPGQDAYCGVHQHGSFRVVIEETATALPLAPGRLPIRHDTSSITDHARPAPDASAYTNVWNLKGNLRDEPT